MTLRTDDLIQILSQSPRPHPPFGFLLLSFLLMAAFLVMTMAFIGIRPDVVALAPSGSFYQKTFLLAGIMTMGVFSLSGAALPVERARGPVSWAALIFLVLVFLGLIGREWMVSAPRDILNLFFLPNFGFCLFHVVLYGVVGAAVLTWLMRYYAPANTEKAARLIGLAAGGLAAIGYSVHCPVDSPSFVAVAYGLPIFGLLLACRLILPRFLNW